MLAPGESRFEDSSGSGYVAPGSHYGNDFEKKKIDKLVIDA